MTTGKRKKLRTPIAVGDQSTEFRRLSSDWNRAKAEFTQALRGGEQLFVDDCVSVAQRFAAHFLTVGQALGADKLDVSDAEEAKHQLQVVFVADIARLAGVQAARSGHNDEFLPAHRPSGPASV